MNIIITQRPKFLKLNKYTKQMADILKHNKFKHRTSSDKQHRTSPDKQHRTSSNKQHRTSSDKIIKLKQNINTKIQKSQFGDCVGCGILNANIRWVTDEYLCLNCRNDIQYKLITKTTVLSKYPNITNQDLQSAIQTQKLQIFTTKNWVDPNAPPIKLFYEYEIQTFNNTKQVPRQSSKKITPDVNVKVIKF